MFFVLVAVAAILVARLCWHMHQDVSRLCAESEKFIQRLAENDTSRQYWIYEMWRTRIAAALCAIGAWVAGGVVLVALIYPFLLQ